MSLPKRRISVGELRPSQLMHSFGIGSVVDLPNLSVIIMGLDRWDISQCQELTEARLLRAVQNQLSPAVEGLRLPPLPPRESLGLSKPQEGWKSPGVPVAIFPRWMKCPACSYLAPANSGVFVFRQDSYRPERNRFEHVSCRVSKKKEPVVLPARFLVVCEDGHLDDFPWVEFVHEGLPCPNGKAVLSLNDGPSGEPSAVSVRCECGARRFMGDALGDENRTAMPLCRGRRPHLPDFDEGGCRRHMKTMLLGASNAWFTESLSVLSLPVSVSRLPQLVEQRWADLQHVDAPNNLTFMRKTGQLSAFNEFSEEAIWVAIQKRRNRETDQEDNPADIKAPEWRLFSKPDPALKNDDFELEPVATPQGFEPWIHQVVRVHRLREVSAMLGFSRLDAPEPTWMAAPGTAVRAPLSRKTPKFVPAVEVRGEGIFLQFKESVISTWCETHAAWDDEFTEAHIRWRRARKLTPEEAGYPGIRYILLHSLSHALMRQVALECGYTAASIAERIYARDEDAPAGPMAGILLYTSAPDSEGTLGGLVSLGQPKKLAMHLEQALEQMRLCASDPLCSEHHPHRDGITLHGAACHACLFAPETSCERGNRYLDRTLLVETLSRQGRAFFEQKGE